MKLKLSICLLLITSITFSQYEINPTKGYSPNIGLMVNMLEDLKDRITEEVKDLDQSQTDFLFDEQANSIGSLVMHLVATEAYYQVETLENRQFTPEEAKLWDVASGLGDASREELKGKPINYYLKIWDDVRQKSLEGLKTKDDVWFASNIEDGVNYHWVWYHVMEHQANHMGQIGLVKNRLPK